MNLLHNFR